VTFADGFWFELGRTAAGLIFAVAVLSGLAVAALCAVLIDERLKERKRRKQAERKEP
jgi:xanthine/uracil permease